MGRKTPQAVTGLRSTTTSTPAPENELEIPADMIDALEARRPRPAAGQVVTYQSRYRNLMVTMEMNDDVMIGNRVTRGKNRHIRFENFQFRTSNPETISWIESQDWYGLGRMVWRESDRVALDLSIDAKRALAGLRHMKGDPEALRQHLGAEDFDALMAISERLGAQEEVLGANQRLEPQPERQNVPGLVP